MHTAIEMQQLPEAGARLAAAAMAPARPAFRHQPRRLQRPLHRSCTTRSLPMHAPGDLVEMPDIEPAIALPIELQHLRHRRHGHPVHRRLATPPIQ